MNHKPKVLIFFQSGENIGRGSDPQEEAESEEEGLPVPGDFRDRTRIIIG